MASRDSDPRVKRTRADVPRVAADLLMTEGWGAITHARVASESGYSRATVYSHWPTQFDLVRDAFGVFGQIPQHRALGDLRADLVAELEIHRTLVIDQGLGHVIAGIAERALADRRYAELRDEIIRQARLRIEDIAGEHVPSRHIDPLVAMLIGAIFYTSTLTEAGMASVDVEQLVETALSPLTGDENPDH